MNIEDKKAKAAENAEKLIELKTKIERNIVRACPDNSLDDILDRQEKELQNLGFMSSLLNIAIVLKDS